MSKWFESEALSREEKTMPTQMDKRSFTQIQQSLHHSFFAHNPTINNICSRLAVDQANLRLEGQFN